MPPLDLLDLSWADQVSPIPGVTTSYAFTTWSAAFGDTSVTVRVVDGRPVAAVNGLDDHAEVSFGLPLRNHLLSRTGRITVAESIGDVGTIDGDFDALLLVAGLLETPAWVAARRLDDRIVELHDVLVELHEQGGLAEFLCATP